MSMCCASVLSATPGTGGVSTYPQGRGGRRGSADSRRGLSQSESRSSRHFEVEVGETAPIPRAHGEQVGAHLQEAVGHREAEAVQTGASLVNLKPVRDIAVHESLHVVVDGDIHYYI